MARLPIHLFGDPVLRKTSPAIDEVTEGIRTLAADMIDTMYAAPGIGLAAPQVGRNVRMIVADRGVGESENPSPLVLINPELISAGKEMDIVEEGCLSLPNLRANVLRPLHTEVAFTDVDGKRFRLKVSGMLSRVIQHEMDHLDGVLFVDRLKPLTRRLLDKDLKALARRQKEGEFA
ncbi:MAG: peptide deformylase [Candidatus Latescibacteria bacterium]|jgi:peptide deformylase|nr:peptide deformylase [Candidatus Latescibacterota bacterium]